ncbi:mechanosensitive ion channel family protein [Desulfohalovibrio reitneri]|uniref:mechanosensitive ion channel family protein n=1 Tax=Desulfohalovibrio reitneri TaxID=1307759 RepID=UPI000A4A9F2D|nr:mechanosensitive ion channel family protein [Desulfohalovibrio reitneri]
MADEPIGDEITLDSPGQGAIFLHQEAAQVAERLNFLLSGLDTAPGDLAGVWKAMDETGGGMAHVALSAAILLAAYLLERLFRRLYRRPRRKLETKPAHTALVKLSRLIFRGFFGLMDVGLFYALGLLLLVFFVGPPAGEPALAGVWLRAVGLVRLLVLTADLLLAARAPTVRLIPLGDSAAKRLMSWLTLSLATGILLSETILYLRQIGPMREQTFLLLYALAGMAQVLVLVLLSLSTRRDVAELISRPDPEVPESEMRVRRWIGRWWHVLFIAFVLLIGLAWEGELLLGGHDMALAMGLSLLCLPGIYAIDRLACNLLRTFLARRQAGPNPNRPEVDVQGEALPTNESPPEPPDVEVVEGFDDDDYREAPEPRGPGPYLFFARRVMRMGLLVILVLVLMEIWGVDIGRGQVLVRTGLTILATLAVGYGLWEWARAAIDVRLEEESQDMDLDEAEAGAGGSRKGTLLTLLRKVILIAVVLVSCFTVLSAMGVNLGPLLAGAGIFGLAIGFGAQTLVRDVFSGLFFLLDDAFRIGDYVETGSLTGTVEHLTIRSLQLRHPRGMVHTIPYGELSSVSNYSRDWVIMKLDIRVPFETDIEKVRKIVKKVGKKLMKDEEHGDKLLAPVKSQGVREIDDSALVTRVKFKTVPGEQFVLRREVYRRIQEAFAANGIQFAPRKVIVHLPEPAPGQPPTDEATKAGAAAAAGELVNNGQENNQG